MRTSASGLQLTVQTCFEPSHRRTGYASADPEAPMPLGAAPLKPIHVLGAGLSGLAAAIVLTRAGREVHVHELRADSGRGPPGPRSEEHTSELQSRQYCVCRLLLEKE